MPTLKSHSLTPRGGWRYLQPQTATWIDSDNLNSLIDKVMAHRTYKGLTPQDKEAVGKDVEDQLCMVLGEDWCFAARGEQWTPLQDTTDKISLQRVLDFSGFMMELVKAGEPMVDKAESERRAAICRSCPFNKPNKTCICTPLYKTLNALVPSDRKTQGLDICGICGCSLAVKVLMPQSVIESDNQKQGRKYPSYCWQQ